MSINISSVNIFLKKEKNYNSNLLKKSDRSRKLGSGYVNNFLPKVSAKHK